MATAAAIRASLSGDGEDFGSTRWRLSRRVIAVTVRRADLPVNRPIGDPRRARSSEVVALSARSSRVCPAHGGQGLARGEQGKDEVVQSDLRAAPDEAE
jgi:hypothetical protein